MWAEVFSVWCGVWCESMMALMWHLTVCFILSRCFGWVICSVEPIYCIHPWNKQAEAHTHTCIHTENTWGSVPRSVKITFVIGYYVFICLRNIRQECICWVIYVLDWEETVWHVTGGRGVTEKERVKRRSNAVKGLVNSPPPRVSPVGYLDVWV